MKDKDFDRLLTQSLREYGHEYLHGGDIPAQDGPVPVHSFPEDFLSDIEAGFNEKKKKPLPFRLAGFASAAAAVFLVAVALVIVPKLINNSSNVSDTNMKMPWEISSSTSQTNNLNPSTSISENKAGIGTKSTSKDLDFDSIKDGSSSYSIPARSDNIPAKEGETIASEQSRFADPEIAYENQPSSSAETPSDTHKTPVNQVSLPDNIGCELFFNGNATELSKTGLYSLMQAAAGMMTDKYLLGSDDHEPIQPPTAELIVRSNNPAISIVIGQREYSEIDIKAYTDGAVYITAKSGDSTLSFGSQWNDSEVTQLFDAFSKVYLYP